MPENALTYIDEFKKGLAHYRPSDAALRTLAQTKLVLLVAPSSSGRNTIIRQLVKTGDYHYVISDTTRHPRVNDGILEQNGREYWFRAEKDILKDIQNGEFLEAAVIHNQQVSGISIRELEAAHQEGKIAITDVTPDGASAIHAVKPDTMIVFVLPPSFAVWIERLHHRGALPEDEVRRRLESAAEEYKTALEQEYYTYVINDDLSEATQQVNMIVTTGNIDAENQKTGRMLAKELLHDTLEYLGATD